MDGNPQSNLFPVSPEENSVSSTNKVNGHNTVIKLSRKQRKHCKPQPKTTLTNYKLTYQTVTNLLTIQTSLKRQKQQQTNVNTVGFGE